jgi:hypothetical protein
MTAPHWWADDAFTILRRGLAPRMPGAKCVGNAQLFDGETPEHINAAIQTCNTCPARNPCHTWASTMPPADLTGIIAGHHYRGPQ